MFLKLASNKKILIGLILIMAIGGAFYYLLARNAEKTVKQALLQRQQLLVRAESSNIASFFQVFGDSLAILAQLPSIEKIDINTAKDLDVFVEQWRESTIVSGIALTDEEGVVKFNSNVDGTSDTGVSLSDRDYFLWAKGEPHESEYFVGKPVISRLGASKGGLIVPVASAIYRNNEFKGALVASVKLNSLTDHYLELIKTSDITEVYLIGQTGEILYGNERTSLLATDQLFSSHLKKILSEKADGKFETEEHLLAYSNIRLSKQDWLLVMATPVTEISNFTAPIFIRLGVMIVLVLVTIFLYGYINSNSNVKSVPEPEEVKK